MNSLGFKNWLEHFDVEHSSPLVMGIMNITPDSFYPKSRHQQIDAALKAAESMIADGVDIIDIGGESTRPGSTKIEEDIELERVVPVIEAIRKNFDICISVDTYKPKVMQHAIEVGANIINDVSGLSHPEAIEIAKTYDVPVCMMHMIGTLDSMSEPFQSQEHIVDTLLRFFKEQVMFLESQNFPMNNLIIDPGIGFGKVCKDNLLIIREIDKLCALGYPVLLGVSRKKCIGEILDVSVEKRLFGSLGAQMLGFNSGCRIFRTHDVTATRQSLDVAWAIQHMKG